MHLIGTRSNDGRLASFKKGAFSMAKQAGTVFNVHTLTDTVFVISYAKRSSHCPSFDWESAPMDAEDRVSTPRAHSRCIHQDTSGHR